MGEGSNPIHSTVDRTGKQLGGKTKGKINKTEKGRFIRLMGIKRSDSVRQKYRQVDQTDSQVHSKADKKIRLADLVDMTETNIKARRKGRLDRSRQANVHRWVDQTDRQARQLDREGQCKDGKVDQTGRDRQIYTDWQIRQRDKQDDQTKRENIQRQRGRSDRQKNTGRYIGLKDTQEKKRHGKTRQKNTDRIESLSI